MFKKKKLQKLTDMANKINEAVSKATDEIYAYAEIINPDIVDSMCLHDMIIMLSWRKVDDPLRLSTSIDFDERMNGISCLKADFEEILAEYGKRVNDNKDKLNNLYEKGMPLFLKFTNLYRNTVMYAMCYEFKRYENGKYKAYVFTDTGEAGKVNEFGYWDYAVEPMTEEEFEQYYIIGRMGLMNFSSESEAIDYDNYLRRLFHGQREVI